LFGATVQQTLYSETQKKVVGHATKGEKIRAVGGFDILSNNGVGLFCVKFAVTLK
jgi:hypothetical protein